MTSPGKISPEELESVVSRGVSDIISKQEFVRLLESGRQLRLKMGFDPSRPDMDLGHVVGLGILRELHERTLAVEPASFQTQPREPAKSCQVPIAFRRPPLRRVSP